MTLAPHGSRILPLLAVVISGAGQGVNGCGDDDNNDAANDNDDDDDDADDDDDDDNDDDAEGRRCDNNDKDALALALGWVLASIEVGIEFKCT